MENTEKDYLTKIFATHSLMLHKLKSWHYNIKNWNFYTLHKLLEEQYTEIEGFVDETAELTVMQHYFIDSSIENIVNTAKTVGITDITLNQISTKQNTKEAYNFMLSSIVLDYAIAIKLLNDAHLNTHSIASQDTFSKQTLSYLKFKWMIEASVW